MRAEQVGGVRAVEQAELLQAVFGDASPRTARVGLRGVATAPLSAHHSVASPLCGRVPGACAAAGLHRARGGAEPPSRSPRPAAAIGAATDRTPITPRPRARKERPDMPYAVTAALYLTLLPLAPGALAQPAPVEAVVARGENVAIATVCQAGQYGLIVVADPDATPWAEGWQASEAVDRDVGESLSRGTSTPELVWSWYRLEGHADAWVIPNGRFASGSGGDRERQGRAPLAAVAARR